MHLEDSMVRYGVYIAETLEKLMTTVHQMHKSTTPNERLFTGELYRAFMWYVNKQGSSILFYKFAAIFKNADGKNM